MDECTDNPKSLLSGQQAGRGIIKTPSIGYFRSRVCSDLNLSKVMKYEVVFSSYSFQEVSDLVHNTFLYYELI